MNKDEAPLARRIREGLRRCLPRTKDEDAGCDGCPYVAGCEDTNSTIIRLPAAMIEDVRKLVSRP